LDADERRRLQRDLARLADGDRTALEPVFERLHPFVTAFCHRVLDDGADDAAHEALLSLYAHVGGYDPERDPLPWAVAFAVNACRTSRRRQQRRREGGEVPDAPSRTTPESELLDAELRAVVHATLATLSPVDAETLALAMGDRPAGATYRKRLERAIARFRAAWSSP
jgi:RNA polymerase sigma-70 factor (ECF subfamily)